MHLIFEIVFLGDNQFHQLRLIAGLIGPPDAQTLERCGSELFKSIASSMAQFKFRR